jgi:uncharacterized protein YfaS (alpha-2-macroglobulin family)
LKSACAGVKKLLASNAEMKKVAVRNTRLSLKKANETNVWTLLTEHASRSASDLFRRRQ